MTKSECKLPMTEAERLSKWHQECKEAKQRLREWERWRDENDRLMRKAEPYYILLSLFGAVAFGLAFCATTPFPALGAEIGNATPSISDTMHTTDAVMSNQRGVNNLANAGIIISNPDAVSSR